MLEINISTILLQMANFLILVFILYRFLYQPLQNMLQKREDETNRAIDEAHLAEQEAEALRKRYEEKTDNIDAENAARKNEARMVIEQTRQQMLHDVKIEIDHLKTQTEEALARLQSEAVQENKKKIGSLASDFAKGILAGVMTPELQTMYQTEFLNKVSEIDLSDYLKDLAPGERAMVKIFMAQSPSQDYQDQLSALIKQDFSGEVNLIYEVDPELIAGGVIRFENELIDGSIQGQINQFQKRYQEMA